MHYFKVLNLENSDLHMITVEALNINSAPISSSNAMRFTSTFSPRGTDSKEIVQGSLNIRAFVHPTSSSTPKCNEFTSINS